MKKLLELEAARAAEAIQWTKKVIIEKRNLEKSRQKEQTLVSLQTIHYNFYFTSLFHKVKVWLHLNLGKFQTFHYNFYFTPLFHQVKVWLHLNLGRFTNHSL